MDDVTVAKYPNINVAIKGNPKTGKTHFALTAPDPIALFSFDIGVKRVVSKFEDKAIEVFYHEIPLLDTAAKNVNFAKRIWSDFSDEYKMVANDKKYRTVIIDTASGLYDICRYAYREETGQTNIVQRQYEEVYARMSSVLMAPHYGGFNLITTYHLKEEYKAGVATGEMILDGYKRTEGLVDVVLASRLEKVGGKITPIFTVSECGFDISLNGAELANGTFDELLMMMFPDV